MEKTTESPLPLYVDLDGTLLRTDSLWESLVAKIRQHPSTLFSTLLAPLGGKIALKDFAYRDHLVHPKDLPVHPDFLKFLIEEKFRGRKLYLVTGAPDHFAKEAAEHFGLFEEAWGTKDQINNTGEEKLRSILAHSEGRPFDYAGNELKDTPLWEKSQTPIVVGASARFLKSLRTRFPKMLSFDERKPTSSILLRAMRIHQWAKNVLLALPLLCAHRFADFAAWTALVTAFFSWCAMASSIYILNDLLDLPSDRAHRTKKFRPLASGELSIPRSLIVTAGLFLFALTFARDIGGSFLGLLLFYFSLTLLYSRWLKKIPVVDVVVLAGLYVLRLYAGGEVAGVHISDWLKLFSMFFFLSLAFMKRCVELESVIDESSGKSTLSTRGYTPQDKPILNMFGISSGFLSVLIFGLYLQSQDVQALYSHPDRLWLICPLLALWLSRVWLSAARGTMHDDPLVSVLRTKDFYVAGAFIGLVWISAL